MQKKALIENLHKIYRNDKWLNELFNSTGTTIDDLELIIKELENQYWFDEITWSLPIYEKLLSIKTNPNVDIEDRRAMIEAKWKSDSKSDLKLIQAVCSSWKNGNATASFVNGKIKLKFTGEYGIPKDLNGLLKALDEIIPTHLPLEYVFMYLLVKDIENMSISKLESQKISSFVFNSR